MTILIVVESPGKIEKIGKMLGDQYKVVASFGHIQDLDPKTLSIDIANNFEPLYIIPPDKNKVVQNLRYNNSQCDEVIIASDLDREGEMIGYSIMSVLILVEPKRIVFNEITKKAILSALEKPGIINQNMVYAQQTRRLLDRLVGYKISPLLWRNMELKTIEVAKNSKGGLSAGRVQSVVVRIIIDKENEIKSYESNTYFKVSAIFNFSETKIQAVLNERIKNKEQALLLLNLITPKTIFSVVNVTNNETNKSPPPPHITSTMMQEASTRHGFSSKKTMDIAQKLYEGGYITYMRTDSTTLSSEAVADCKKYIDSVYGSNYYQYRSKTNSKDAQEAHEAIRPTKIETLEVSDMPVDNQKLYTLIWKRTVASLMASAIINIQTVEIEGLENKINIFNPIMNNLKFKSNFETIIFDGYLILNNKDKKEVDECEEGGDTNSEESDIISGNIDIKKDSVVEFNKMDATEEYTKAPLRYNEAGLIKYLKKNGIGRPSTYSSIISKIIERSYVEIKNVDGVKKNVCILSLGKKVKKFVIKEDKKTITLGKENMKIIPTEMGILVNNFMMTHFAPIMDIKFTADMEKMLDQIANGKALWHNVLDTYYKLFSPMVEQLEKTTVLVKHIKGEDKLLGYYPETENPIFLTKGKYGYCIKLMEGDKCRFASIEDTLPENITLEESIKFLEYPKTLGKIGSAIVTLNKGKFGLYFKVGIKSIAIKDTSIEPTLEYAKKLAESNNTFVIKNKVVQLKNGQYGYYLMIPHGTKKPTNIPIPPKVDITTLTAKMVSDIMTNYEKYKNK